VATKESIFQTHLYPVLGDRKLDAIGDEDVQRLKATLASKSRKTVNNVLSVLNKVLKVALRWKVISTMPCTRLVEAAARIDSRTLVRHRHAPPTDHRPASRLEGDRRHAEERTRTSHSHDGCTQRRALAPPAPVR
jgi:hypothetical protein